MSSLAATQADGYYLPPEYYDGGAYKKQSKNAFDAAKNGKSKPGHNQWLQNGVVRFELPYKGVCEGSCGKSIMRGTRYNAKKITTEEKYFTSPIYEFQMNCRNCQHEWRIRTNPKERGFDYVSGIHIQAGQESMVESAEVPGEVEHDALDRLESTAHGKRRAMTEMEELQRIQKLNQSSLNDADHNALIRKGFRKERKAKRKRQENAAQIGWRTGMEMFSEDKPMDVVASKEATYGNPKKEEQKRIQSVRTSSIFSKNGKKTKGTRREQRSTDEPPSPVRSSSSSIAASNTEVGVKQNNLSPSVETKRAKTKKKLKIGTTSGRIVLQKDDARNLEDDSTGKATKSNSFQGKMASSSLADVLAGYGSSSEGED